MFDRTSTAPGLIGSRYATRLSKLRSESLGRTGAQGGNRWRMGQASKTGASRRGFAR
ncbi:hypothetical protein PISMIDRAFT_685936 [Pisolithus microcarpus 441]|uniref:Uncharacterized protein n=1 Tax=Pisolithus microcarpus 441 TaxID=765257 RepID=A0A0C9Z341_9AGAM|nr:hypothetical protein PISMIDRAFT_685936 [Pisolithus microcarpus 441]